MTSKRSTVFEVLLAYLLLWKRKKRPALWLDIQLLTPKGEQTMAASVTINTLDAQHLFTATIKNTANAPLSDTTGYGFTWTPDDGGAFIALGANENVATVKPRGLVGVVNLKCVASKGGSPSVSGTIQITIQGEVADHVDIDMTS